MKIKALLLVSMLCLCSGIARADIVWVEGLGKAADRSTIILTLESRSESTFHLVIRFAEPGGVSAVLEIPRFRSDEERRSGIEKILRALNDPKGLYIKLEDLVKDAGIEGIKPKK